MEDLALSLISVVLFCVCCRQFIKAALKPIPRLAMERTYARPAMQIGKVYKTMAWGAMSGTFLMGLIFSFQQVFQTL